MGRAEPAGPAEAGTSSVAADVNPSGPGLSGGVGLFMTHPLVQGAFMVARIVLIPYEPPEHPRSTAATAMAKGIPIRRSGTAADL